jgi:predicted nucleic acid-binding protein
VVEEDGTPEALALRSRAKLIAPDLLVAECANVLWKKVTRGEFSQGEALIAAALLERAEVELYHMRSFLAAATQLAIDLGHPAYDCVYLACAIEKNCRMVTADRRFLQRLARQHGEMRDKAVSLEAAVDL